MNEGEEYFIRELTRKLDEQINSVRRELENLKKVGFLRSKVKDRKKYYYVNKSFIIIEELKGIFVKVLSTQDGMVKDIAGMGKIKLLVLSGMFIDEPTASVDMLIVGDIDKEKLSEYLNKEVRTQRPVKLAIISEEDYKYRVDCKDKFVSDIVDNEKNQIAIKKI